MSKTKPNGLKFLDNQVKEINKMKEFLLDDKGSKVKYFPKFSEKKIDNLLLELTQSIVKCKEENIDFLKNGSDLEKYTYYLIIKHFTEFKDFLDEKDIYENIAYLEKMYEVGWFNMMVEEMFDFEEIQKVLDKRENLQKLGLEYQKQLTEQTKIIEENVKNESLKVKAMKELNDLKN